MCSMQCLAECSMYMQDAQAPVNADWMTTVIALQASRACCKQWQCLQLLLATAVPWTECGGVCMPERMPRFSSPPGWVSSHAAAMRPDSCGL